MPRQTFARVAAALSIVALFVALLPSSASSAQRQQALVPTSTGLLYATSANTQQVTGHSVVNADVSSSAAIVFSKLGTTGTETLVPQQFDSSIDAKGTQRDVEPVHASTTDATVTTIGSFSIASNTSLVLTMTCSAIKSDASQGAAYCRTAAFRNNAGTVAQIGTTQDCGTLEDDAAWDATIDNSTTTIRERITGKAATNITWTCVQTRLEVIP